MTREERVAQSNIGTWKRSTWYEIYDAYDSFSKGKVDAWKYCKSLCKKYDGRDLKVVNRNCHKFTAGFEYTDKDTGEIMFMYITKGYNQPVSMGAMALRD